jgi:hypothetical protein
MCTMALGVRTTTSLRRHGGGAALSRAATPHALGEWRRGAGHTCPPALDTPQPCPRAPSSPPPRDATCCSRRRMPASGRES